MPSADLTFVPIEAKQDKLTLKMRLMKYFSVIGGCKYGMFTLEPSIIP